MQEPASLTVRYVSRTAARSARRHLFVPIPKGSTWMPVRPRGRASSSAGIAGPLTRRKRRWLVGVMTLASQGYAIATTAASSSAATSVSGQRQDQEGCAGKPDQARGVNGNAEQTEAVR